ncbi:glycosyltransferase family 2 protein [Candidatus Pelagibacter sp. HIMB1321]|uniref:glycosyltransferase family 2 protein n=1 Tax=Candidatus Pelagibacter sp. HIMB1321 TaxID=1388755 RepID=UPI000A080A21|nr:glycosyltransferase [Candidatus Pelagibacter sp. HIMB1321]SMF79457.1 Glycosyltransferase involved in cell wall bisynthesis [Candidatus Pelagibacter sp. HIMB1321]
MHPLVSVIVNCHNGSKYLEKCIKSILNQKYQNLEIIFYDNFSNDGSKEIVNKLKDKRVKYYYSSKKLSLYKARNEAIKKTSGNLIAFLDADDWWDSSYLSEKKKFFINKKYDFFYSNVFFYHEKNNKFLKYNKFDLPDGKIFNYLANQYFIIISGLILRKKILKKENYFNDKYNIIGDYDLIMRISKYANAKSFNEPLVYYRVHNNNLSKLSKKMHYEEYREWYYNQEKNSDKNFEINKDKFLLELLKLKIINGLYQKKDLKLLILIFKIPKFKMKLKYLLAFLLPLKIVDFFRK